MECPEGEVGRGTWLMLGDGAHILDLQRLASLLPISPLLQFCKGDRASNPATTLAQVSSRATKCQEDDQ